MPDLVDRLMGVNLEHGVPSGTRIPIHGFCSVLAEYIRGGLTGAEATALWDMTAAQISQAQALIVKMQAGDIDRKHLKDVLYLAELGEYDRSKVLARLGF